MSDGYVAWAHCELLGHRSHWGLVSERQVAGASFLEVATFKLGAEEPHGTFLYPPSSVYCLTPCTEERARLMATPYSERPEELRQLEAPKPWDGMDVDVDDDYEDADVF